MGCIAVGTLVRRMDIRSQQAAAPFDSVPHANRLHPRRRSFQALLGMGLGCDRRHPASQCYPSRLVRRCLLGAVYWLVSGPFAASYPVCPGFQVGSPRLRCAASTWTSSESRICSALVSHGSRLQRHFRRNYLLTYIIRL